jgi:hypothetical protein
MIVMINERNGHKTKFKSYKKLYDHIAHSQRCKRRNKPIEGWVFSRHSYGRAMDFYNFVCTQKEKAKENTRFDVLEMSYDKSVRPVMIPIMPNADIEPHLEDWCRKYCKSHGFKLIEVQDDDGILRVKKERADVANVGLTYNIWWKE